MPTYEYKCEACGHAFEKFQSMTSAPIRKCPVCGKKKVKRLIGTGAALIFKGSGFYITDYRSEAYKKDAKGDSASSTPPSSSPASGGEAGKGDAPKSDASAGKSDSAKAEPAKAAESKPAEAKPAAGESKGKFKSGGSKEK